MTPSLVTQEPEELEPGAGAGTQDVTELGAWQKCSALSAVGMSVKEVLPVTRCSHNCELDQRLSEIEACSVA